MRDARRGSALIEFAGSLILLTALFTGVFQVGYTFLVYNKLVNAVRSGARYASLPSQERSDQDLASAVRQFVVYGQPGATNGAESLVPGLSTENVEVIFGPATTTVRVRGFELDALFSKVRLDGRPSVTFPSRQAAAQ